MIEPVDLIGFGSDISEVRTEIEENFKLLNGLNTYFSFYDRLKETRPELFNKTPILYKYPREKVACAYLLYARLTFLPILEAIQETPYKIHPLFIAVSEGLFYTSNLDDLFKILDAPKSQFYKYYEKLHLETQRFSALNQETFIEFIKSGAKSLKGIQQTQKQTSHKSKDFAFYFAFTLRQIPTLEIDNFLMAQGAVFPKNKDYNRFLNIVLIKYKKVIPSTSRKIAKLWLKNNNPFPKISQQQLASFKAKINLAPALSNGVETPNGWFKIPSKIPIEKIRDYFSYFYLEKNESKDGLNFISKDDIETLFQNGLVYPNEEPKEKSIIFNKAKNRPWGILYYFVFKLYQKNAPHLNLEEKMHYSRFLKYRFKGINIGLKSLNQSLREDAPASLKIKKFNEYYRKLD